MAGGISQRVHPDVCMDCKKFAIFGNQEGRQEYDHGRMIDDDGGRFVLQRFVTAQEGCYDRVLAELRSGVKRSHWMWFVFPQLDGLGCSPMSRRYAIRSLAEARAYLDHPVLGKRLTNCCLILLHIDGQSMEQIFGYVDTLKLHSSMTLFCQVAGHDSVYDQVLDRYFDGRQDESTLSLLKLHRQD